MVNTGTVSVCVQALWLDEWSAIFLLGLDSATDNRAHSSSGSNHRNCLLVPQEAICRPCGGMLILQAAWPPAACPCDWLQQVTIFEHLSNSVSQRKAVTCNQQYPVPLV